MKNSIAWLGALILLSASAYGQSPLDYFVVGTDTTFCNNLRYRQFSSRHLKEIRYEDLQGKEVVIFGKKATPDVTTFCIKGKFVDKNPYMPNGRKGNFRYDERNVDGEIKVYHDPNVIRHIDTSYSPILKRTVVTVGSSSPAGTYRFLVKMPDGSYHKVVSPKVRYRFIVT